MSRTSAECTRYWFARSATAWRLGQLGEVEHEREGFVDGALLGCGESAGEAVEAFDVDGPELLDEDAGVLAGELDLWAKCRRSGAA
jgi:hypothetical protein